MEEFRKQFTMIYLEFRIDYKYEFDHKEQFAETRASVILLDNSSAT